MASTPPWLPEERPRAPLPSAAIQRASCMSVLGTLASLRDLQSAGGLGGVWCCWWRVALSLGDSRLDSNIYSAEVTFSSQSCRQGPPCLSMALLRIALTASWLKHGADPALNHYGIIHGRQWEGLNHSNVLSCRRHCAIQVLQLKSGS